MTAKSIMSMKDGDNMMEETKVDNVKSSVALIDCTGMGHPNPHRAIDLLLFTKQTRLEMKPEALSKIESMPVNWKMQELEYMANTIPSSWEFVDYTFLIRGVTRAFTHQLVRTRTASFAQQTMRILDVGGWDYGTGPSIKGTHKQVYDEAMTDIALAYNALVQNGVAIEDARGILPTNILTNIVMKCNMRTFVEMVRKRSSLRTQDEYRVVLQQMKDAVRSEHPWIDLFIDRTVDRAIADLEQFVKKNPKIEERIMMTKLLDQLRAQV